MPLEHLNVSAGQPRKAEVLSNCPHVLAHRARQALGGHSSPLLGHLLHPSSSLPSPQSLTPSQTQKRGLQNLFLHMNWLVVLHPGWEQKNQLEAPSSSLGSHSSRLPEMLSQLNGSELLCTIRH